MLTSTRRVAARLPLAVLAFLVTGCGGGQAVQSKNAVAASPPASAIAEPAVPSAATEQPAAESERASDAPPGARLPRDSDGKPAAAAAVSEAPQVVDSDTVGEFRTVNTHTAKSTHGVKTSTLVPTNTEALLKFVVVDKETGPIEGIVISLTGPGGDKFYTQETDAVGFSDVLVPVGKKYQIVFLSLGRKNIAATVTLENEPRLTQKMTLRYKRIIPPPPSPGEPAPAPRFTLEGVNFDTAKAIIRPESYDRLDSVVEYLIHKKTSRIEISGHTDDVGNARANQALSEKRAAACREYFISKGIDGTRIKAVGYGDTRPVAPNDTDEGRAANRRIEATELKNVRVMLPQGW
jgi:outer membrane protein OmpA-like peptidoglycan-associated protein